MDWLNEIIASGIFFLLIYFMFQADESEMNGEPVI